MDLSTWYKILLLVGSVLGSTTALVVAITTAIKLRSAQQDKRDKDNADLIKAKKDAELGTAELTAKINEIAGKMIEELKDQVIGLQEQVTACTSYSERIIVVCRRLYKAIYRYSERRLNATPNLPDCTRCQMLDTELKADLENITIYAKESVGIEL